jgi:hypothetical protein
MRILGPISGSDSVFLGDSIRQQSFQLGYSSRGFESLGNVVQLRHMSVNAQLLRKPPLRAALRVDSERKPRECAGLFVVCLVVSLLCELGGLAWVQLNVESERLQAFDQVTLQTQGSEVVKVLSAQFVILQFRML